MAEDMSKMVCKVCGNVGLEDGYDGYYYCAQCGSQADDIMETGVADEDFIDKGADQRGALYQSVHTRHRSQPTLIPSQPLSQPQDVRHSQFWSQLKTLEETAVAGKENGDRMSQLLQVKRELEGNLNWMWPTEPGDFGTAAEETGTVTGLGYEDYYHEVRNRYLMGVQMMIQYQCEALVEKFKVKPSICGLVGPIWLRFVALSGVCEDDWADGAVQESEIKAEEAVNDTKRRIRNKAEPHTLYGERAITVWAKSLRKSIPLYCSLAISFLACHISREPILPTEIVKWSLEGKLPYFSCFIDIGKQMGTKSSACPIGVGKMFKPSHVISSQKLEVLAASIAKEIGLTLPPVNFYAIAYRYLEQLSLPVDKILPHACRLQNWSMASELYLSANEARLPSRVCVLSILLVAIRILNDINGFGVWEKSLGSDLSSEVKGESSEESVSSSCDEDSFNVKSDGNPPTGMKSEFEAEELLRNLEAKYHEIAPSYEYFKDLDTLLRFCNDVAFAGAEESSFDNEYKTIQQLYNYYTNEKDSKLLEGSETQYGTPCKRKRSQEDGLSFSQLSLEDKKFGDKPHSSSPSNNSRTGTKSNSSEDSAKYRQASSPENKSSSETPKDRSIKELKKDMEENRFCYIPPRVKLRLLDYLHYARKREEGGLTYVAHADYYILLRVFARIGLVDARIMHIGVMSFEKRLAWLENRIKHCLHLTPPAMTCEFCSDIPGVADDFQDDAIGLSGLSI